MFLYVLWISIRKSDIPFINDGKMLYNVRRIAIIEVYLTVPYNPLFPYKRKEKIGR